LTTFDEIFNFLPLLVIQLLILLPFVLVVDVGEFFFVFHLYRQRRGGVQILFLDFVVLSIVHLVHDCARGRG